MLVTVKAGKGRIYHKDGRVDGKYVVHLLDEKDEPKLTPQGKPLKMLVKPENIITLIGFVD